MQEVWSWLWLQSHKDGTTSVAIFLLNSWCNATMVHSSVKPLLSWCRTFNRCPLCSVEEPEASSLWSFFLFLCCCLISLPSAPCITFPLTASGHYYATVLEFSTYRLTSFKWLQWTSQNFRVITGFLRTLTAFPRGAALLTCCLSSIHKSTPGSSNPLNDPLHRPPGPCRSWVSRDPSMTHFPAYL